MEIYFSREAASQEPLCSFPAPRRCPIKIHPSPAISRSTDSPTETDYFTRDSLTPRAKYLPALYRLSRAALLRQSSAVPLGCACRCCWTRLKHACPNQSRRPRLRYLNPLAQVYSKEKGSVPVCQH